MIKLSFLFFIEQQLLLNGAVIKDRVEYESTPVSYFTLRDLYDENHEACKGQTRVMFQDVQPSLFGLTIDTYRQYRIEYYGDKNEVTAEAFYDISYDLWYKAMERQLWKPLFCERMPKQQVANVAADTLSFIGDVEICGQVLLQMLEEQRVDFKSSRLEPLNIDTWDISKAMQRLRAVVRGTSMSDAAVTWLIEWRRRMIEANEELSEQVKTEALQYADKLRNNNLFNQPE